MVGEGREGGREGDGRESSEEGEEKERSVKSLLPPSGGLSEDYSGEKGRAKFLHFSNDQRLHAEGHHSQPTPDSQGDPIRDDVIAAVCYVWIFC